MDRWQNPTDRWQDKPAGGVRRSGQPALVDDAPLRHELLATLAALHELGPRYQPELVSAFLDRLDPALQAHVSAIAAHAPRPSLLDSLRDNLPSVSPQGLFSAAVGAMLLLGMLASIMPVAMARHPEPWRFQGHAYPEQRMHFSMHHRAGFPFVHPVGPPRQPSAPNVSAPQAP